MINKLQELINKRRSKLTEYINTNSKSWKKQLRKMELDNIDIKIKIEKLKLKHK